MAESKCAVLIWSTGSSVGGGPLTYWPHLRVGDVTYQLRVADTFELREGHSSQHSRDVLFLGYQAEGRDQVFSHIPYEDDRFAWAAGLFLKAFAGEVTEIAVQIGDDRPSVRPEELRPIDTAAMAGPVWCPVANMKAERPYGPSGQELKSGSKHFAPGAKLYCFPALWGDGYDQIRVIGHHRGSHRYATMVVRSSWLTNWRIELVYSPYIIRKLWPGWDGSSEGKERAQQIVDMMREREATAGASGG